MEKRSFYQLTTATSRDQHIALRSPEKQSSQFTSMQMRSCALEEFCATALTQPLRNQSSCGVSGAVSVVGEDLANESVVTSIQEILRLNASAVSMSVFVGSKYENKSLSNLAKLVDECEDYGIPVMAVSAVGKELEKREARYLALGGANFRGNRRTSSQNLLLRELPTKSLKAAQCPVVIAGGPKTETQKEVFDFVYDGMQAGAIGVNLGTEHLANRTPRRVNQSHPSHNP